MELDENILELQKLAKQVATIRYKLFCLDQQIAKITRKNHKTRVNIAFLNEFKKKTEKT